MGGLADPAPGGNCATEVTVLSTSVHSEKFRLSCSSRVHRQLRLATLSHLMVSRGENREKSISWIFACAVCFHALTVGTALVRSCFNGVLGRRDCRQAHSERDAHSLLSFLLPELSSPAPVIFAASASEGTVTCPNLGRYQSSSSDVVCGCRVYLLLWVTEEGRPTSVTQSTR